MQGALEQTFQHVTDYNDIKDTIGSGSLTTTSQTLIGAVNEVNDLIGKLEKIYANNSYVNSSESGYISITIPNGTYLLLFGGKTQVSNRMITLVINGAGGAALAQAGFDLPATNPASEMYSYMMCSV